MSEEKNVVFGIDLGTTYSCISYVDENGNTVIVKNLEGDTTTPSVVFYESPENVVVGDTAKSTATLYPDKTISFVKRSMGKPGIEFEIDGKTYTPEVVSSHILRKLAHDASEITGIPVTDVVITHPAYFGINEKEATKNAGKIAGLNVVSIMDEPVAAAYSYGCQNDDGVVLVYDLGGGTFDVTLIDIKTENGEKNIKVVCTGGDSNLGGKDWDDAIIQYIATEFEEQTGTSSESLQDDPDMMQDLMLEAEKMKKQLTSKEKAMTAVNFEGEKARIELTRETFESLTSSLLERTVMKTKELLEEAKTKGYASFDKLLLVGGSTYMPQVSDRIKNEFGVEPQRFDPNEAVSKGAALYGHSKAYEQTLKEIICGDTTTGDTDSEDIIKIINTLPPQEKAEVEKKLEKNGFKFGLGSATVKIQPVTSKSFGVEVVGRKPDGTIVTMVNNIIIKNTNVPCDITATYGTFEDNQVNVDIKIYESEVAEEYIELDMGVQIGQALLDIPAGLPANAPIDVTFQLTEEGLLTMKAVEKTGGKTCNTTIETKGGMSKEQVAAATKENAKVSVADDGGFDPVPQPVAPAPSSSAPAAPAADDGEDW